MIWFNADRIIHKANTIKKFYKKIQTCFKFEICPNFLFIKTYQIHVW